MKRVLILRPQPGADETAARARAKGFDARVAPIFKVRPVAWDAPPAEHVDALLLTSANAVRHGGAGLARYANLGAYAVGEATANAAREAGFRDVRTGDGDGAAVLALAIRDGKRKLLRLVGRDYGPLTDPAVRIETRIVYDSVALPELPDGAADALLSDAVVLLHSARAARRFGTLADRSGLSRSGIALAGFSPAVIAAAGTGWRATALAEGPTDESLLAAAAGICEQTCGSGVSQ